MAEINGKLIGQKILDKVRNRVEKMKDKPSLAVVMVGDDKVSSSYVDRKSRAAEYAGIRFSKRKYFEKITTQQLIEELQRIQLQHTGVIVQLPLPKHIETQKVLDSLNIEKDVDCLSSKALGRVMRGVAKIYPPTAAAVLEICKTAKVTLKGKHVVVVGQGELVGKPVVAMLANEPVTLTVCGLGTKDLAAHTRQADILISGTGKQKLIKAGMVKKTALVIDAGASVAFGKIVGDVDPAVAKKVRHFTPVPGGVGPITVAKLFENLITLAE